jgi:dTDP-glucose 4,6-dehydratase
MKPAALPLDALAGHQKYPQPKKESRLRAAMPYTVYVVAVCSSGLAMRILVAGAAGFVGLNFVEQALANGADIIGYDINDEFKRLELSNILFNPNFEFRKLNLAENQVTIDDSVTHVVHFAALAHVDFSNRHPDLVIRNNVNATITVLEAVRRTPRPTLIASSVEVYGGLNDAIFVEDDLRTPLSPYAVSKVCCEDICSFYRTNYNLALTLARFTNLVGPWQSPDRVVPRSIARAIYGLPLIADQNRTRDFLDVRDAVRAVWLALASHKPIDIVNVCSGKSRPVREVVASIAELCGSRFPVELRSDSRSDGRGQSLSSSPARAARELAWTPTEDFSKCITETSRWYSTQRSWLAQFDDQIRSGRSGQFLVDDRRVEESGIVAPSAKLASSALSKRG